MGVSGGLKLCVALIWRSGRVPQGRSARDVEAVGKDCPDYPQKVTDLTPNQSKVAAQMGVRMVRRHIIAGALAAATAFLAGHACAADDFTARLARMFDGFSDSMSMPLVEAVFPGPVLARQGPYDATIRDWTYEFHPKDRAYTVNVFQQTKDGRPDEATIFTRPIGGISAGGPCEAIEPLVSVLIAKGWSPPQIKELGPSNGVGHAAVYMQRARVQLILAVSHTVSPDGAALERSALSGCLNGFDIQGMYPQFTTVAQFLEARPLRLLTVRPRS